ATARSPWRTPAVGAGGVDGVHASMRPRLGRRGEPVRRERAGAVPEASMRPRLGRRGERGWGPAVWYQRMSFNAATARSPWRTVQTERLLRFGTRCFNAATARSPWRTPQGSARSTQLPLLQCGHGSVAVENTAVRNTNGRMP